MDLQEFLNKLRTTPEAISFQETIDTIHRHFHYTPAAFRNGPLKNAAGQNEGSCKIFALGQTLQLSEQETLQCFGDYYRKDIVNNPGGQDHANIRNFLAQGWEAIAFEKSPLAAK